MRLVRLFAALVAALTFGGLAVAGTASAATTVEDCQAQLATLSADTLAAETSFTNAKSVTSLTAKVDAASAKLAEGKNADAVQKLGDFQATLDSLATAAKPKVAASAAQSLTAETQGVIDCINAIDVA
jgi:hypothetical protein